VADWSKQDSWTSVAANPAQPAGLTQAATQWGMYGGGPAGGPMADAKAWYGGRNLEGPGSGWDTDWLNKAGAQYEKYSGLAAAGNRTAFYDWLDPSKNKDATGVALWDDEERGIRAGDTFTDGVKGENLYDVMDENTADVLMGEFMFDGKKKAEMGRDGDPAGAWRRAVQEVVDGNTELRLYGPSAQEYEEDVAETQEKIQEGIGDEALALTAGATAAASSMAVLGWFGPAGWIASGVIGTAVAGATWLNRDQVSEVAARAWEKADRAAAQHGGFESAFAYLEGVGTVGNLLLQPGQNLVQGLYDDERGDGKSKYYEPALGEETPWYVEAANLGGSVLDAFLQFSSPVSAGAYLTTMGMSTIGRAGMLATTNSVFNDSRGMYDQIEDAGEFGSAWAAVGIEGIQMMRVGAIGRAAGAARRTFGREADQGVQIAGLTKPWAPIDRKADQAWANMPRDAKTRAERKALIDSPGQRTQTINGVKFFLDERGVVQGSRLTTQILAPSEFARWLPMGWRARTMRALDQGQTGVDDLYRAALHMSQSGNRFTDALINGYTESVEELVQAYFEPRAVGDTASWDDLRRAAMYGATSGFGMSLGSMNRRPPNAQIEKSRARTLFEHRTQQDISEADWDERWNRMSTRERALAATATPEEIEELKGVAEVLSERMEMEAMNSPFSTMGAQDTRRDAAEKDWANPRNDNTLSLKGLSGETLHLPDGSIDDATYRATDAVMSAVTVLDTMRRKVEGFKVQEAELQKLLKDAQGHLDQAREDGNADQVERWTAELAKLQERRADTDGLVEMAEQLYARLRGVYNRYRDETDPAMSDQLFKTFNDILDGAWTGTIRAPEPLTPQQLKMLRRAVEFQTTRHPTQDRGSFSVLRMRASKGLSRLGAHGSVHTHQSLLKVIGGDHDGDNRVTLNMMYVDPATRRDLGMGKFAREVDVQPTKEQAALGIRQSRRWKLEIDRPDGEARYVSWFSRWAGVDGPQSLIVREMFEDLSERILNTYSKGADPANPFEEGFLIDALSELYYDIRANVPDAVVKFTETLLNHSPTAYSDFHLVGERNDRAELSWLMAQFNYVWDHYSTRISTYNYGQRTDGPPRRSPAQVAKDAAFLVGKSIRRSINAARMMNMLYGSDATRSSQHTHYSSVLNAAVALHGMDLEAAQGYFTTPQGLELARDYMQMGSGDLESDLEAVLGRDRIEGRVLHWLERMVADDPSITDKRHAMLLLASTAVRDIRIEGENLVVVEDGTISMLQFLLRRSLMIEEAKLERGGVPKDDPQWAKMKRLKGMTYAQSENSYSASQALVEVFGGMPMRDLIGDAADAIGANVTMNQYLKATLGMSSDDRNERFYNLRSPVNGYLRLKDDDGKRKDPPYSAEVLKGPLMNSYSVLVDAMRAVANNHYKNLKSTDDTAVRELQDGFGAWQQALDSWREAFVKPEEGQQVSDEAVLDDFLRNAPTEASRVLVDLIPDAAKLGVFQIKDGRVYVSKWVRQMLLEKNSKKAAKTYFVMTKLEQWRQMQGTQHIDEDGNIDTSSSGDKRTDAVKFERINSRFLQTLYIIGRDPLGLDLEKFLMVLDKSPDIETIIDAINNNPRWLAGREKLLAFHDDVAQFEADPKDVWNSNLPGQLQREAITAFNEKIGMLGVAAVRTRANKNTEDTTLRAMDSVLRLMPNQELTQEQIAGASNQDLGFQNLILLQKAIENRLLFPDTVGPNARLQYFKAIQEGLIQMHNKGAADRRVAPMGEPSVLVDSWGVDQGVVRELDSITATDYEKILSNPTELVRRKVEVQMPDGSTTVLDFTTVRGALDHLMNPATNALAKAVLFPTVRDVNTMNVPQIYLDVDDPSDFTAMLQNESHVKRMMWHDGKVEGRPSLQQALWYIQMIESHVRGESRNGTDDERAAAEFPIMHMLDDFLIAYQQGITDVGGQSLDKMRDNLIIDMAVAIREISKIPVDEKNQDTKTEPDRVDRLKDALIAVMRDRYYEGSRVKDMGRNPVELMLQDTTFRMAAAKRYQKELVRIREQLSSEPYNTSKRANLEAQEKQLLDWVDAVNKTDSLHLNSPEHRSADQLHSMYAIDWTQDPDSIRTQQKLIVDLLSVNGNMRPFRDKSTKDLIANVLRITHDNPVDGYDAIEPEQWNLLSGWVIETLIRDETGRPGSDFGGVGQMVDPDTGKLTPVGRYFDRSFAYLVEPLFATSIRKAAATLRDQARDQETLTDETVLKNLESSLFAEKKFGEWTGQVPVESIKYRKVLGGAPVGLSVAVAGSDPVKFADYVGGSIVSTKEPEAQHMSTAVIEGRDIRRGGIREAVSADPLMFIKLQNHFVRSVKITSTSPEFQANHPDPEFVKKVGNPSLQSPEVEKSGYYILHLDDLQNHLQKLAEDGLTDFRVEIEYVDVDKKPWTREWAHNLYFDGVGREAVGASTRGPIASLVFALAALSKQGQQDPLNYATKGGSAYAMYIPSDPALNEEIERTSSTVTEYMSRKALHMWSIREYDTGPLLASDLPSLYKLVKMRHLVRVKDPETGEFVLKWPEQIIYEESQHTGPNPLYDMKDIKIIKLGDRVARTLWGASGFEGVDTALGRPILNLQDMDTFPSLDKERLRKLGLTGLGETIDPGNSVFSRVVLPSRDFISEERGTDRKTLWEQKIERWGKDREAKQDARMGRSRPGVENYKFSRIAKENEKKYYDMLAEEEAAGLMMRLGVPMASMQDMTRSMIGKWLAQNLGSLRENVTVSTTWMHQQGGASNLAKGLLTEVQTENGLSSEGLKDIGPTFGDVVILDLDSFIRAAGGPSYRTQALRDVKRAISVYANKGVMIALGSAQGDQYFRADVADWLDSGSLGYVGLANNRHIFVPATEETSRGRDALAMESLDTAVGVITPHHVTFNYANDLAFGTAASENASYRDFKNDPQWKRTSAVIFPSTITKTSPDREKEHLFNIPVGKDQRNRVYKMLSPLLETDEGKAWLTEQFRDRDGNVDPSAPRYYESKRKHPDGRSIVDPGVVFLEDALLRLQNRIEAGVHPLDDDEVLIVGDVVPVLDQQGNLVLVRHGFKPPKARGMERQFKTPLPGDSSLSGGIATSRNELEDNQTISPPLRITRTYQDKRRGLVVEGEWDLDPVMKRVWEATGFKSGDMPVPINWRLPGSLSREKGNHIGLTQFTSEKAVYGKAAVQGVVDNFSDAFTAFGIDLRPYLIDFFYGKGASKKNFESQWNDIQRALERWQNLPHKLTQRQAISLMHHGQIAEYARSDLTQIFQKELGVSPNFDLRQPSGGPMTVGHQLAWVVLSTLTVPGVKIDHIIQTPGLTSVKNNGSQEDRILQMPSIFTDALDDSVHFPELRHELFENIRTRLPDDFMLLDNWDFYAKIVKEGEGPGGSDVIEWSPGRLQYILPLPASENPAGLTQSGIGSKQSQTQHVTNVINAALGGRIAIDPKAKVGKDGEVEYTPTRLDQVYNNSIWRPGEQDAESFYSMITRINPKDSTYSPYPRRMPEEDAYLALHHDKRRLYRTPLNTDNDKLWNESQRSRYETKQDELLGRLGLTADGGVYRTQIDYLVRQFVGRPGARSGQDPTVGEISGDVALQVIDLILTNVRDYQNPLHGGVVFTVDRHFMQAVYRAQEDRPLDKRWSPMVKEPVKGKTKGRRAEGWEEWVKASIGQFEHSNQEFRVMFLSDIDAFFTTWHDAHPGLGDLPVSIDQMRSLRLINKQGNEAFLDQDPANDPIISLDPGRQAELHDPIILDSMKQTLDTLIGHKPTYNDIHAEDAYASPLKEQLDRQKEWLASNKLAKQQNLRTKDYIRDGTFYKNTTEYQNQFMKNLVNLSLTMRLANPALWVSALMEVPARNMLEHATNILTGRNISLGGKMAAGVAEKGPTAKLIEGGAAVRGRAAASKVRKTGGTAAEAEAAQARASEEFVSAFRPKYTPQQVHLVNELAKQLGQRKEWMSVLYDEMTYQQLVEGANIGAGGVSKRLERAATFTARATSDPRYGMKATSVAKRYIEAALETMHLTGEVISVEQFVSKMSKNPMWLRDQYADVEAKGIFSPHRAGMNRVAQVRSTKQTAFNKVAFGWMDSLMKSGSGTANIFGHMLKIPFMFTRFNINALMTITGLTAWDQAAAMFFDKRKKPAFLRKNGKPETWDMSDVIETLDLHRTFIRSGVTYSMLMTLGMMAGNLGLGGEDEEERRRQRMAKNLGLPMYLDPLDAANQFQFADAMFLDSIPVLNMFFNDDKGNSIVVPHWIIRQFTSPIIGMQRFFETGDWKEIRNGFLDAFSAIPNSVVKLWDQADVTAVLLADQANKEAAKDTPQAMANTTSLLISIVGVYEKALFENSFINSWRNGADKYDRNPFAIPGINPETGEIARYPGSGTPMSQEDALVSFQNEEGEIQQGYMSRQGKDGILHQYAENNLTAALVMSLFSGDFAQSTYLRKNMVPRIQEVELDDSTRGEVEALIYSAWLGQGGMPPLSKLEIINQLKDDAEAADTWWDQDEIEERAEMIFQSQEGQAGALSILTDEGKELVTTAGADSVFHSLATGAIKIGDPALDGFGASYEMRQEIAAEWGQRLVQEGLDLGLSYEQSFFRAKRFWYGDDTTGDPGLRYILFSNQIPTDNDLRYFQLNHTYAIGPDGRPWATPFPKMGFLQSLGVPLPTQMGELGPGLGLDENGRVIDLTVGAEGINTGLSGLEKIPDLVSDMEPDDSAFEGGAKKAGSDSSPSRKFGYSRSGGYSGGGGGYTPQMRALPGGAAARFEGMPMINAGSPYTRRANVNRQRIWSERERLKQWQ
jgi:hypothetical protein